MRVIKYIVFRLVVIFYSPLDEFQGLHSASSYTDPAVSDMMKPTNDLLSVIKIITGSASLLWTVNTYLALANGVTKMVSVKTSC